MTTLLSKCLVEPHLQSVMRFIFTFSSLFTRSVIPGLPFILILGKKIRKWDMRLSDVSSKTGKKCIFCVSHTCYSSNILKWEFFDYAWCVWPLKTHFVHMHIINFLCLIKCHEISNIPTQLVQSIKNICILSFFFHLLRWQLHFLRYVLLLCH